jgi:uncharacterized protein YcbK (DUF882 family)
MSLPLLGPLAFAMAMEGASAGEIVRPFEVAPASEAPECWASQETLPMMPVTWAVSLGPLHIRNVNTGAEATLSLYRTDGTIDPDALDEFSRVACSLVDDASQGPHPLALRTVQLVVKAAYFFKGADILAISSYRAPKDGRENHHSGGDALDFQLDGVKAPYLAAYLRREPRVGVGIYTHPRTQYVHLDLRDEGSYHWMDGSPPGVTWREQPLLDWTRWKKDPSYKPEMDLPAIALKR